MILRKLKKTLSTASSTTINLPFIATVRGEAKKTVERSAAGFYRNRENQDFVLL